MRTAEPLTQESSGINLRHQVVNRTNMAHRRKMRNPCGTQLYDVRSNLVRICKRARNSVERLAPAQRSQLDRNTRLTIELFHKPVQRIFRPEPIVHDPNRKRIRGRSFSRKRAKHYTHAKHEPSKTCKPSYRLDEFHH